MNRNGFEEFYSGKCISTKTKKYKPMTLPIPIAEAIRKEADSYAIKHKHAESERFDIEETLQITFKAGAEALYSLLSENNLIKANNILNPQQEVITNESKR